LLHAILALVMSGYVDDAQCGSCHADVARTYQAVGMARSFTRPRPAVLIEDFDAQPFVHAKSGQTFEMRRVGNDLLFRRYRVAADGAPIDVFEQRVDWILGSGNHARTYLFASPSGELTQLPLAWYSRTREWRMAPGYDRRDHEGVTRRVRYECMFCHNAYTPTSPEPLSYWRSQRFPSTLPEGIGCQRCHGPGAKHVEIASAGSDPARTRAAIVNPARLPLKRRTDICYQCHMQPTVVISGLRRFGRDVQSFRPGEPLDAYAQRLDIDEADLPRAERYEINHHPYRLEQSRCFLESEGQLTCLTCHNPHRKVADAAHFRKACMSCHAAPHRVAEDCTSCHMPKRRPQDVVHVVMTDHRIQRGTERADLLAMREEREPVVTRVETGDPLYDLVALTRATGGADREVVERLADVLARRNPAEIEPYLDLAAGWFRQRRWSELEATTRLILARDPTQELALEWRALARAALTRDTSDAIRVLSSLSRPEATFNAGALLSERGRWSEAIVLLERSVRDRPAFAAAWMRLGDARRECGDSLAAMDAYRRTLEIEPSHARAREALVALLVASGNRDEAERYRTVASGR
jgi:Tfp pilus assembly protein PilF